MITPVLQHAVDLMNDSHEQIEETHSHVHSHHPSKSDDLPSSHHVDSYQVFDLSFGAVLSCISVVSRFIVIAFVLLNVIFVHFCLHIMFRYLC